MTTKIEPSEAMLRMLDLPRGVVVYKDDADYEIAKTVISATLMVFTRQYLLTATDLSNVVIVDRHTQRWEALYPTAGLARVADVASGAEVLHHSQIVFSMSPGFFRLKQSIKNPLAHAARLYALVPEKWVDQVPSALRDAILEIQ